MAAADVAEESANQGRLADPASPSIHTIRDEPAAAARSSSPKAAIAPRRPTKPLASSPPVDHRANVTPPGRHERYAIHSALTSGGGSATAAIREGARAPERCRCGDPGRSAASERCRCGRAGRRAAATRWWDTPTIVATSRIDTSLPRSSPTVCVVASASSLPAALSRALSARIAAAAEAPGNSMSGSMTLSHQLDRWFHLARSERVDSQPSDP